MAAATFRFFTTKRVKGGWLLNLRGRQVASIYKQPEGFVAFRASNGACSDYFQSAEKAEEFVWCSWV